MAGSKQSRPASIETELSPYLHHPAHAQIEARDLEVINKAVDELSEEIEDVLCYQQI